MVFGYKRALKTLVLPGGLVLGVAALLFQAVLAKIPASVLEFYYYAAFASGLLLAWRFHSSRVFSALLLLLLAHRAVQFFAGQLPAPGLGLTALEAISFIIPLNFALLALRVSAVSPLRQPLPDSSFCSWNRCSSPRSAAPNPQPGPACFMELFSTAPGSPGPRFRKFPGSRLQWRSGFW